jgi:hypothetical protein
VIVDDQANDPTIGRGSRPPRAPWIIAAIAGAFGFLAVGVAIGAVLTQSTRDKQEGVNSVAPPTAPDATTTSTHPTTTEEPSTSTTAEPTTTQPQPNGQVVLSFSPLDVR